MSTNLQRNGVYTGFKDAKFYQKNSSLQRRDVTEILEEYSSTIKWKVRARVLDVGCGDGGVTTQVLKPYLPNSFERLVGCDISEEMIRHANLTHKSEKVNFKTVDVSGSGMESLGQFDHIFSFFALHWVQEQEKAISNIYSALAPDGDCLLMLIGYSPFYDRIRILAEQPRWKEYIYDLKKYISPYHDSENPEEEFRSLLKKTGFKDVEVQCKNKVYTYEGIESLKSWFEAMNPFKQRMTADLQKQFLDDCLETVRHRICAREEVPSGGSVSTVTVSYSVIVAHAVK